MANLSKRTTAFNVERVRADILARVRIPDGLLQKAFDRLHEELDAKKTEFFAHQGEVISKVDVIAHETRLNAIDKVMKVSGVYARENDTKNETPQVAMEIDQKTGVMRLVIGGQQGNGGAYVDTENNLNDARPSMTQLAPPDSDQLSLFEPNGHSIDDKEETPEVQVVSTRGKTPEHVMKLLYGETDG